MTHLILHKVRGSPALDVAEFLPEMDMWIIPTSGHRAYPYLVLEEVKTSVQIPLDHPDHYSINDEKPATLTAKHRPQSLTLDDLD